MVKVPVHSIQQQGEVYLVRRLKEPRFTAMYNPKEPGRLSKIYFEGKTPENAESLYTKALAAVKHSQFPQ